MRDLKDYISVAKHICEFEVESNGHGIAVRDALYGMMPFIPVDTCILDLEAVLEARKKEVAP
ncbi:conserved hypothetical protein [delta proteobacterium NaphS2]|nr:conserved hypothetical protein [delta proteobacterium NaphS2]